MGYRSVQSKRAFIICGAGILVLGHLFTPSFSIAQVAALTFSDLKLFSLHTFDIINLICEKKPITNKQPFANSYNCGNYQPGWVSDAGYDPCRIDFAGIFY